MLKGKAKLGSKVAIVGEDEIACIPRDKVWELMVIFFLKKMGKQCSRAGRMRELDSYTHNTE